MLTRQTSFNPRPRAGGDTLTEVVDIIHNSFNPRPRAGGDLNYLKGIKLKDCFNPRPRAGGDSTLIKTLTNGKVSIHAPARGATATRT